MKSTIEHKDALMEVLALMSVLRDAVANADMNPNASRYYYVLIDEVCRRLEALAK